MPGHRIQRRRRFLIPSSIIAALVLGAAACSSSASTSAGSVSASVISQELAGKVPPTAKDELNQTIPLTTGQAIPGYPNGVSPSSADNFHFTAAEIAKLKAGHYTAAIAMHLSDAAWPELQIKGITTTLATFGIKVVATTSANGVAATQVGQLAALIGRKPTAIFSIPVNPTSEATEYKQIEANGIKLILLDNVPPGMTPSQDYVTSVSANNGGNGLFAAEQLYKTVGCAPIGVIGLDYFFPVVNVR